MSWKEEIISFFLVMNIEGPYQAGETQRLCNKLLMPGLNIRLYLEQTTMQNIYKRKNIRSNSQTTFANLYQQIKFQHKSLSSQIFEEN